MEQILVCMYNAHHERGKRRMRERATEKKTQVARLDCTGTNDYYQTHYEFSFLILDAM